MHETLLDELKTRLFKAGMPRWCVLRTTAELHDHACELQLASEDVERVLFSGSIEKFASTLICSYRSAKWIRRTPNWICIIAPAPLALAVCLLFYAAGVTLIDSLLEVGSPNANLNAAQRYIPQMFFYAGKIVTPFVATNILCLILSWVARPAWVLCTAVTLLAVVFFLSFTEMSLPTATDEATFLLTVEIERLAASTLPWQLTQATVVLVTALFLSGGYRRLIGRQRAAT